ncbi:MAG: response regulator [Spirochaetota bacterium]
MNKRWVLLTLSFLTIAAAGVVAAHEDVQALYIDSYHQGYPWSDGITEGLMSVLTEENISLAIEHLDAKRNDSPQVRQRFYSLLEEKYREAHLSAVIVSDDPAFNFALQYRGELFGDIPLIFLGLNQFEMSEIEQEEAIYGVADSPDHARTLELAARLHPGYKTLVIAHDQTVTGLADRERIEQYFDRTKQFADYQIHYITDVTKNELASRARALPSESIILALHFVIDQEGAYVDPDEYISLLDSAGAPIYIVNDLGLGSSPAVGGYIRSSVEEGKLAAELALSAVRGTADTVLNNSDKEYIFNYEALEQHQIPVKALPPDSRLVNQPERIDRQMLFGLFALAVLSAVLLVVLGLLIHSRRQLRQQSRMLQRVFDLFHQPVAALYYDDNSPIFANRAMVELVGISEQTLIEMDRIDLNALLVEKLGLLLPEDVDDQAIQRQELAQLHVAAWHSGSRHYYLIQKTPFLWKERQALLTTLLDVTEQTEAQEQLRQTEKMQVVGQLTGGIAHDFNNQLMAILGYAEILKRELTDSRLKNYVEYIMMAAENSEALTGKLLSFTRKEQVEKQPVCLNERLQNVVGLLKRSVDRAVSVRVNPVGGNIWIHGEATAIDNALLNLGLNAADAVKTSGTISFVLSVVDTLPSFPVTHSFLDNIQGPYAQITIQDTGSGMSEEVQRQMFSPFYTTKKEGHGTGMGLAAVFRTVKHHQGAVLVNSSEGHGSEIVLCFPLLKQEKITNTQEQKNPSGTDSREASQIEKTQGRILVVDDERLVRFVITKTLRDAGYDVVAVKNGFEAVQTVSQEDHWFDLIVLDMIMPGMNGHSTFQAIRHIRPEMAIMMISGYSDMAQVKELKEAGLVAFIEKPFNRDELLETVKECLTC